ncbi:hypothetical protein F2Q69_00053164 [Brassica cretica]|uniref:Uncharacterized protein n=1 Tax=Brassica cretica TaxID=69181 RepID=A0A8S9MPG3_BRACR|nr:hypothetical protein F2Q69_00053164 [Brassica cretica]
MHGIRFFKQVWKASLPGSLEGDGRGLSLEATSTLLDNDRLSEAMDAPQRCNLPGPNPAPAQFVLHVLLCSGPTRQLLYPLGQVPLALPRQTHSAPQYLNSWSHQDLFRYVLISVLGLDS